MYSSTADSTLQIVASLCVFMCGVDGVDGMFQHGQSVCCALVCMHRWGTWQALVHMCEQDVQCTLVCMSRECYKLSHHVQGHNSQTTTCSVMAKSSGLHALPAVLHMLANSCGDDGKDNTEAVFDLLAYLLCMHTALMDIGTICLLLQS